MKMKKVGRLLSLVVAGAMALSMIPAAFAADNETAHVQPTTCFHEHMTYVSNGDGSTHKEICDDCKVVLEEQMSCLFMDGKCTKCGAPDPTCQHLNENYKYVANNNGTHDVVCTDCGAVAEENVPCDYVDGKCQLCGATCDHMANSWKYESTDHGTHKVICAVCGKTVDELGCLYVNGKCKTCGAPEPACQHLNENYEYVDNHNGTHNVVCADCGAVAEENVPCDYILDECVHCGGLYAGGNVPFFVSTGKGLLRSLRSFFMGLFIR